MIVGGWDGKIGEMADMERGASPSLFEFVSHAVQSRAYDAAVEVSRCLYIIIIHIE